MGSLASEIAAAFRPCVLHARLRVDVVTILIHRDGREADSRCPPLVNESGAAPRGQAVNDTGS